MADEAMIVVGGADFQIGGQLGYIKEGVTVQKSEDILFIEGAEGVITSPKAFRTKLSYTISATVIEPTLANLKILWDSLATAVSPMKFGVNDELGAAPERQLDLKSVEPGTAFVRTVQVDRAVSNGPGEVKFTQFEEVKCPMVFETVYNDTDDRVLLFSDPGA